MWRDPNLGRWSRTNQLITEAARRLGACAEEVCDVHTDALLRLTRGERSVLISRTRSPNLTAVANKLANHKYASGELLRAAGLPVVSRIIVDDIDQVAQWEAVTLALSQWGSTIVKPNWENRARGVAGPIHDLRQLRRAIELAMSLDADEEALIEPALPGKNLRVAVVGEDVAAAIVRRPVLSGDGVHSITDLIAAFNTDPRRGAYDAGAVTPLDRIEPDEAWWRVQALIDIHPDTVLATTQRVTVYTEEAESIDVTDTVHPAWVQSARRALRLLNIDVGGVDFIVDDPTGTAGHLLEVNCQPALHLHALPTQGTPRPVFDAFVQLCLEGS
jgi:D-alanine-D-alanine ligase-like ATP-grasp enzyme